MLEREYNYGEVDMVDVNNSDVAYLYKLVFVFLVSFFVSYLYLSYTSVDKSIETRSLKKAIAQFYRDGLIMGNPRDLYYYLNIDEKKLIFDENTAYIKW
ncbi:MAG: hypothetical protein JHC31_03120 [Sulfurihydrogenibium sp.]|jgi:hypothetical protein|nr:hypothetical protein [Sulfurihydrogenibium sp.]